MRRLAAFIHGRARLVLALTALLTVFAAVVGSGVVGSLSDGGSSDPGAPSTLAQRELTVATGVSSEPALVVLVHVAGPVLGPVGRRLILRADREMRARPVLARVLSVLDRSHPAGLLSRDGRTTVLLGFVGTGVSNGAATAAAQRVQRDLGGVAGITVGGSQLTFSQLDDAIASQLPRVELIAFAILLLLSFLAFRGLVAASLPLMVGVIAVAGSLLIMRALAEVTSLSIYSLNLVTGLGLGLAIDYSLFIVYRYREELATCGHCAEAVQRTLATAGRTVAFSSLTVSAALLSLLAFPQPMLRSMGIAAAVVTVFAAAAALIPLVAMLALLGPRVNALAPRRLRRREPASLREGRWYRFAMVVMRRPALVAIACAALLLAIGLPAAHLRLGSTDSRVLPPGSSARLVDATVASNFAADAVNPVTVVVRAPANAAPQVRLYAQRLGILPGAARVLAPTLIAPALWRVDVLAAQQPLSTASQGLVAEIRATRSPGPALVAIACAALLLAIGLPAAHLRLGSTDSRVLPPGSSARLVDATVASSFAADAVNPVTVVVRAPANAAPQMRLYAQRLGILPGAARVLAPTLIAPALWRVDVLAAQQPLSTASQGLVAEIRATRSPGPALVAGVAAEQYDQHASLRAHMALALPILVAATLLVLFAMTGSVVLAIKSLVMTLLTLSGAFGILVAVFQHGRFQQLLGYTSTGTLEQTNMIILFIIAFGLSTDYGVFLLSRIKEAHEGGAGDRVAVAAGLQRSGPVVTAAALLFCAAVGSLGASSIASLKEFGAGAAIAVILDATVVRAVLVPSLMALLGRANWWAPGNPLPWLRERIAVRYRRFRYNS